MIKNNIMIIYSINYNYYIDAPNNLFTYINLYLIFQIKIFQNSHTNALDILDLFLFYFEILGNYHITYFYLG